MEIKVLGTGCSSCKTLYGTNIIKPLQSFAATLVKVKKLL